MSSRCKVDCRGEEVQHILLPYIPLESNKGLAISRRSPIQDSLWNDKKNKIIPTRINTLCVLYMQNFGYLVKYH